MLKAILTVLVLITVASFNLVAAITLDKDQMKEKFITNECLVGRFFVNIFYAPAWMLKGLRIFFLWVIA